MRYCCFSSGSVWFFQNLYFFFEFSTLLTHFLLASLVPYGYSKKFKRFSDTVPFYRLSFLVLVNTNNNIYNTASEMNNLLCIINQGHLVRFIHVRLCKSMQFSVSNQVQTLTSEDRKSTRVSVLTELNCCIAFICSIPFSACLQDHTSWYWYVHSVQPPSHSLLKIPKTYTRLTSHSIMWYWMLEWDHRVHVWISACMHPYLGQFDLPAKTPALRKRKYVERQVKHQKLNHTQSS